MRRSPHWRTPPGGRSSAGWPGDATVGELAAPFDMSLPGISKHLKVLERSGLISRGRAAQFRPCHLEVEALDGALDWIGTNRRLWHERFDKLDTLLADLQRAPRLRSHEERKGTPVRDKTPRRRSSGSPGSSMRRGSSSSAA